jgi:hypothetical protein
MRSGVHRHRYRRHGRFRDQARDGLARPSLRPVRVVREEVMDGVDVDPRRIVVDLDAAA